MNDVHAHLQQLRKSAQKENTPQTRVTLAVELAAAHSELGGAGDLAAADELLQELRELACNHDEAPLREALANALFNAHFDACKAKDSAATDGLLQELRELALGHDEAPVREVLAKALVNAHSDAGEAGDSATEEALLRELRDLARDHNEAPVRERLAMALFNAHSDAGEAGNSAKANSLVQELRDLRRDHDEAPVRERLAMALFNAHFDARKAKDSATASSLLQELRELALGHDEAPVREVLAKALVNAHADAEEAGDSANASSLLQELRDLARSHDEAPVSVRLANALFNAHIYACNAKDTSTADALLQELRALSGSDQFIKRTLYEALCISVDSFDHAERTHTLSEEADKILETFTPDVLEDFPPRTRNKYRLIKVVKKFSSVSQKFMHKMQHRQLRNESFLEDKSHFSSNISKLFVLRQWNSYTPIIVDGEETDRGGGYFIYHHTPEMQHPIGLIIDPGYNFIEHFHAACCRVHDITHIAITHAHDDHTAQLEQIFTLLHQYNSERKKKHAPIKKITLLLNHSVCKKFSGFDMHKGAEYIHRVITLNAFDAHNLQRLRLEKDFFLTVLPAYHNDLFSSEYAIGLGLEVGAPARRLLFTGDTGLFPPLLDKNGRQERYTSGKYIGEAKVNEEEGKAIHKHYPDAFKNAPDLLVPHLGSIKPYEFKPPAGEESPMFYPNHLGLLGTAMLIEDIKPTAVIVSEFGAELKDIRGEIVHMLKQTIVGENAEGAPHMFPGDTTIVYNITDGTFLCHGDGRFYPPESLEFHEIEGGVGVFYKKSVALALQPFRNAQNTVRHCAEQTTMTIPLPYLKQEA